MKEYDIKITEVLEKTVQVQADSREEAEAIASENWNNSLYEMDSAEDYADVSFHAGEERDISPPEIMDVLLVSPGEYPREVQVGTELEDLQEAVGGMIECVYPFDEQVGLIVNEEGKFNGSLLNRALYSEDGKMVDVIAGDFLVVGLTEDNFGSLTPEQMLRYEQKFHQPETFIRMGRSIMALPIPEDQVKRTMAKKASRDSPGRKPRMSFAGRSGKQDSKSCGHDNKADRPECACRLHEISPAPGAGEGEKSGGESSESQGECHPARQTDRKGTDRAEPGRI